jgi:hypothetical protein
VSKSFAFIVVEKSTVMFIRARQQERKCDEDFFKNIFFKIGTQSYLLSVQIFVHDIQKKGIKENNR